MAAAAVIAGSTIASLVMSNQQAKRDQALANAQRQQQNTLLTAQPNLVNDQAQAATAANQARARAQSMGATARRATILTSPLGVPASAESPVRRPSLLGGG